jgi:hypothetical protein
MNTTTRRLSEDEKFERKLSRKIAADAAAGDRAAALFDRAWDHVGELNRDGRPVFYIFPVGGKYREGSRAELADFLVRNGYVH